MTATRSTTARSGTGFFERWALLLLVVGAVGVIVIATLLGAGKSDKVSSAAIGNKAPDFSVADAVSGRNVTLSDLKGKRTLMFFSEGASCQACLVQIRDLEREKAAMRRHGIDLVSVSTDPPDVLASVARQYGMKSPLLSDESTDMSKAYGMLGKGGMGHPNADGHAFILLDRDGRVEWEQAYSEMYVPPKDLLASLP